MKKTDLSKLLVIAGSAKAGTSALAQRLGSRPDMVLGKEKETKYFSHVSRFDWQGPASAAFVASMVTRHEDYLANFEGLQPGQWAIDGSTDYIWREESPGLLLDYARNCDVRVICIVRDPIDRAISEYNQTRRFGWETLSFSQSIAEEDNRIAQHWHPLFYHQRRSRVHDDIRRYHDAFGAKLLVLDYATISRGTDVLDRISDFLDIPRQPEVELDRVNQSIVPRSKLAGNLIKSSGLRTAARALLPAKARALIWQKLHIDARKTVTATAPEIALYKARLQDEVAACRADPLIPTGSWSGATGPDHDPDSGAD